MKRNGFCFDGIAFVERPIDEPNPEFDGVVRRQWIISGQGIVDGSRYGFFLVVEHQPFESGIEADGVVALGLLVPAEQRGLLESVAVPFQVVDKEVVVMRIVGSKRIDRVGIVKPQVAVTVGIADAQDDFARQGAVGIHQVVQTLIGDLWLDGVFHLFLAGCQEKEGEEE